MCRVGTAAAAGVLVVVLALTGCAHRGVQTGPAPPGKAEQGDASWYGEPYHGRRTASGEVYDMYELSAAHRDLAFGTVVRVTRRDSGAAVEVRINDRGPFVRGRIIDLSFAAARAIGLDADGVAPVRVEVVGMAARSARDPAQHSGSRDCVWVQVGAFAEIDNARRARARLDKAGHHAVVMEAPGGLHRVRVGPFGSRADADEARRRLADEWPAAALVDCGG